MPLRKFFRFLAGMAVLFPSCASQIETVARRVRDAGSVEAVLPAFLREHPDMRVCFLKAGGETDEDFRKILGTVYPVHGPYSDGILARMELAGEDEHYRNWANTLRSLPEYTLPIRDVDPSFVKRAREIWRENICGHEEVLQVILRHSVEYQRTGRTVPILLLGDPGIGKTLVARNYGRILDLPCSFLPAPAASMGRGLAGAPNVYVGAGAGAVVQAMIDHEIGNPVIVIDEVEKAEDAPGRPGVFQNELLAALDESSRRWCDNFLEVEVDASHIPYILTANEPESIPPPLLDRMEVVGMKNPDLEMMHRITRLFTLPGALKEYDTDRIEIGDGEIGMLVDMLWMKGNRSCRPYQKAVKMLVSQAYLRMLEGNGTVRITEKEILEAVARSENPRGKTMGFGL